MFGTIRRSSLFKEWDKRRRYVPALGERKILCNWVADEVPHGQPLEPLVDMQNYSELLSLLPDKIVENLEKARLSRDGRMPVIKAGLGYEELLSSVIVDGTAITSSSTENILFPDLLMPPNFMQPGGLPGRTLRWRGRGRVSTIVTTQGTLTFNFGSGTTAVTVPTVSWAKSGAITSDAVAVTASQWMCEGDVVTRTVGTAGTVFAQGYVATASGDTAAVSAAKVGNYFMGSAGPQTPSTASFDMTLAQYIAFTAKWSLATAYSITGHMYMLESLN